MANVINNWRIGQPPTAAEMAGTAIRTGALGQQVARTNAEMKAYVEERNQQHQAHVKTIEEAHREIERANQIAPPIDRPTGSAVDHNATVEAVTRAVENIAADVVRATPRDITVTAQIIYIIDIAAGQYRLSYTGGTMTAQALDRMATYNLGEEVYVLVPGGDFTRTKTILGRAAWGAGTSFADRHQMLNQWRRFGPDWLSNQWYWRAGDDARTDDRAGSIVAVTDISHIEVPEEGPRPYYRAYLFDREPGWLDTPPRRVALTDEESNNISFPPRISRSAITEVDRFYDHHSAQMSFFEVSANFQTEFSSPRSAGDYGLLIECRVDNKNWDKENDAPKMGHEGERPTELVTYKMSCLDFNGNPYALTIPTPQRAIFGFERGTLKGLVRVSLYQEGFHTDVIPSYGRDGMIFDINEEDPGGIEPDFDHEHYARRQGSRNNIHVTDVQIHFVEQINLANRRFWMQIDTPLGTEIWDPAARWHDHTRNLPGANPEALLRARVFYGNQELTNEENCEFYWYREKIDANGSFAAGGGNSINDRDRFGRNWHDNLQGDGGEDGDGWAPIAWNFPNDENRVGIAFLAARSTDENTPTLGRDSFAFGQWFSGDPRNPGSEGFPGIPAANAPQVGGNENNRNYVVPIFNNIPPAGPLSRRYQPTNPARRVAFNEMRVPVDQVPHQWRYRCVVCYHGGVGQDGDTDRDQTGRRGTLIHGDVTIRNVGSPFDFEIPDPQVGMGLANTFLRLRNNRHAWNEYPMFREDIAAEDYKDWWCRWWLSSNGATTVIPGTIDFKDDHDHLISGIVPPMMDAHYRKGKIRINDMMNDKSQQFTAQVYLPVGGEVPLTPTEVARVDSIRRVYAPNNSTTIQPDALNRSVSFGVIGERLTRNNFTVRATLDDEAPRGEVTIENIVVDSNGLGAMVILNFGSVDETTVYNIRARANDASHDWRTATDQITVLSGAVTPLITEMIILGENGEPIPKEDEDGEEKEISIPPTSSNRTFTIVINGVGLTSATLETVAVEVVTGVAGPNIIGEPVFSLGNTRATMEVTFPEGRLRADADDPEATGQNFWIRARIRETENWVNSQRIVVEFAVLAAVTRITRPIYELPDRWSHDWSYAEGCIVHWGGKDWVSLQDGNLDNNPTEENSLWWRLLPTRENFSNDILPDSILRTRGFIIEGTGLSSSENLLVEARARVYVPNPDYDPEDPDSEEGEYIDIVLTPTTFIRTSIGAEVIIPFPEASLDPIIFHVRARDRGQVEWIYWEIRNPEPERGQITVLPHVRIIDVSLGNPLNILSEATGNDRVRTVTVTGRGLVPHNIDVNVVSSPEFNTWVPGREYDHNERVIFNGNLFWSLHDSNDIRPPDRPDEGLGARSWGFLRRAVQVSEDIIVNTDNTESTFQLTFPAAAPHDIDNLVQVRTKNPFTPWRTGAEGHDSYKVLAQTSRITGVIVPIRPGEPPEPPIIIAADTAERERVIRVIGTNLRIDNVAIKAISSIHKDRNLDPLWVTENADKTELRAAFRFGQHIGQSEAGFEVFTIQASTDNIDWSIGDNPIKIAPNGVAIDTISALVDPLVPFDAAGENRIRNVLISGVRITNASVEIKVTYDLEGLDPVNPDGYECECDLENKYECDHCFSFTMIPSFNERTGTIRFAPPLPLATELNDVQYFFHVRPIGHTNPNTGWVSCDEFGNPAVITALPRVSITRLEIAAPFTVAPNATATDRTRQVTIWGTNLDEGDDDNDANFQIQAVRVDSAGPILTATGLRPAGPGQFHATITFPAAPQDTPIEYSIRGRVIGAVNWRTTPNNIIVAPVARITGVRWNLVCPICLGSGTVPQGEVQVQCGNCGGNGFINPPTAAPPIIIEHNSTTRTFVLEIIGTNLRAGAIRVTALLGGGGEHDPDVNVGSIAIINDATARVNVTFPSAGDAQRTYSVIAMSQDNPANQMTVSPQVQVNQMAPRVTSIVLRPGQEATIPPGATGDERARTFTVTGVGLREGNALRPDVKVRAVRLGQETTIIEGTLVIDRGNEIIATIVFPGAEAVWVDFQVRGFVEGQSPHVSAEQLIRLPGGAPRVTGASWSPARVPAVPGQLEVHNRQSVLTITGQFLSPSPNGLHNIHLIIVESNEANLQFQITPSPHVAMVDNPEINSAGTEAKITYRFPSPGPVGTNPREFWARIHDNNINSQGWRDVRIWRDTWPPATITRVAVGERDSQLNQGGTNPLFAGTYQIYIQGTNLVGQPGTNGNIELQLRETDGDTAIPRPGAEPLTINYVEQDLSSTEQIFSASFSGSFREDITYQLSLRRNQETSFSPWGRLRIQPDASISDPEDFIAVCDWPIEWHKDRAFYRHEEVTIRNGRSGTIYRLLTTSNRSSVGDDPRTEPTQWSEIATYTASNDPRSPLGTSRIRSVRVRRKDDNDLNPLSPVLTDHQAIRWPNDVNNQWTFNPARSDYNATAQIRIANSSGADAPSIYLDVPNNPTDLLELGVVIPLETVHVRRQGGGEPPDTSWASAPAWWQRGIPVPENPNDTEWILPPTRFAGIGWGTDTNAEIGGQGGRFTVFPPVRAVDSTRREIIISRFFPGGSFGGEGEYRIRLKDGSTPRIPWHGNTPPPGFGPTPSSSSLSLVAAAQPGFFSPLSSQTLSLASTNDISDPNSNPNPEPAPPDAPNISLSTNFQLFPTTESDFLPPDPPDPPFQSNLPLIEIANTFKVFGTPDSLPFTVEIIGRTHFNYFANGRIKRESALNEVNSLQARITWNGPFIAGYSIQWMFQKSEEGLTPIAANPGQHNTESAGYSPIDSMLHGLWVSDNSASLNNFNVVRFRVREKLDQSLNNNDLWLRIEYLGEIYDRRVRITFTKDGDPGTNGRDWSARILPVNFHHVEDGTRAEPFTDYQVVRPLHLTGTPEKPQAFPATAEPPLILRPFIEKLGRPIQHLPESDEYRATIRWDVRYGGTGAWDRGPCETAEPIMKSVANTSFLDIAPGNTGFVARGLTAETEFKGNNFRDAAVRVYWGNRETIGNPGRTLAELHYACVVRAQIDIYKGTDLIETIFDYHPVDLLFTRAENRVNFRQIQLNWPSIVQYDAVGYNPEILFESGDPLRFNYGPNAGNVNPPLPTNMIPKLHNEDLAKIRPSLLRDDEGELIIVEGDENTPGVGRPIEDPKGDFWFDPESYFIANTWFYTSVQTDIEKMEELGDFADWQGIYEVNEDEELVEVVPPSVFIRPQIFRLMTHGNADINGWDGRILVPGLTDNFTPNRNGEGAILAPTMGAGWMNPLTNKFTGVIMGKNTALLRPAYVNTYGGFPADQQNTQLGKQYMVGIFGYQNGISSFGLLENGVAYFGRADRGRIYFDGVNAQLYGGRMGGNSTTDSMANRMRISLIDFHSPGNPNAAPSDDSPHGAPLVQSNDDGEQTTMPNDECTGVRIGTRPLHVDARLWQLFSWATDGTNSSTGFGTGPGYATPAIEVGQYDPNQFSRIPALTVAQVRSLGLGGGGMGTDGFTAIGIPGSRRFLVTYDGTMYAMNAFIKGNLIGSNVIGSQFFNANGTFAVTANGSLGIGTGADWKTYGVTAGYSNKWSDEVPEIEDLGYISELLTGPGKEDFLGSGEEGNNGFAFFVSPDGTVVANNMHLRGGSVNIGSFHIIGPGAGAISPDSAGVGDVVSFGTMYLVGARELPGSNVNALEAWGNLYLRGRLTNLGDVYLGGSLEKKTYDVTSMNSPFSIENSSSTPGTLSTGPALPVRIGVWPLYFHNDIGADQAVGNNAWVCIPGSNSYMPSFGTRYDVNFIAPGTSAPDPGGEEPTLTPASDPVTPPPAAGGQLNAHVTWRVDQLGMWTDAIFMTSQHLASTVPASLDSAEGFLGWWTLPGGQPTLGLKNVSGQKPHLTLEAIGVIRLSGGRQDGVRGAVDANVATHTHVILDSWWNMGGGAHERTAGFIVGGIATGTGRDSHIAGSSSRMLFACHSPTTTATSSATAAENREAFISLNGVSGYQNDEPLADESGNVVANAPKYEQGIIWVRGKGVAIDGTSGPGINEYQTMDEGMKWNATIRAGRSADGKDYGPGGAEVNPVNENLWGGNGSVFIGATRRVIIRGSGDEAIFRLEGFKEVHGIEARFG